MSIKNPIFWEKTVEWEFVQNYLSAVSVSAPLDGDIEVGDAILGAGGQWFVLEFKGVKRDCVAESKKYPMINKERARVLVRRHYFHFRHGFYEAIDHGGIDWWDDLCAVEYFHLLYTTYGPYTPPSCPPPPPGVFGLADAAHNYLLKAYRDVPWTGAALKEPHFFVFASKTFRPLHAWPYWSDCHKRPGSASRGLAPFDATKLWVLGQSFADFARYVHIVATARGYDLTAIEDLGAGDDGLMESLVFGHVMATASSAGKTVVMPMRKLVTILPNLIQELQLDMAWPPQRTNRFKP
ncbi:hypothetical protein [Burkholderia vietnamiensis]|uniref:hypothetical protein n=1 Tax=Burkholderia vietnamiensis TaxID=60552 RepID=UPI000ADF9805|nr:hypothetical protein [Burkholderia vietnamiensis]MEC4596426.1 hypothetical protein [Burkholderia vietnamiensis]